MPSLKTPCVILLTLILATQIHTALGLAIADETKLPHTGAVGQPFILQLKGRVGSPPYHFRIDSGNLPPGLSVSKDGLIQGRPTTSGEFKFWANLFDAGGESFQRPITITITPGPEPAPPAEWEKLGWTLTFSDDFDNKSLYMGHWIAAFQGNPKMPASYAIENGLLHVRLDAPPAPPPQLLPLPRPEKTGRVSSVETQAFFMQQFGLFETRARFPTGPSVKAVIWMSPALAYESLKSTGGTRPSADDPMEIDAFEQIPNQPNALNLAVHFGQSFTTGHQVQRKRIDLPFSPSDGFHIYALQWDENALVWYVDGKEVHRSDKSPHTPLFFRLSIFEDGSSPQETYPKVMQVDYVRMYQRSTPTAAPK